MAKVDVVHWNPPKVPGKLGRLLVPICGRIDNFGDLLGPEIVRRLAAQLVVGRGRAVRLLAVGSIMKLAGPGDVVWGAGVNGKSVDLPGDYSKVDVRAVRGPLTAAWLRDRGASLQNVYGDPGLLVSRLWPEISPRVMSHEYTIIPNLHDEAFFACHPHSVSPRLPFDAIRDRILSSEFVIGSSLHGIIVAESYGIPARLIRSTTEPAFKYEDYYRGSGRSGFRAADDVAGALALGGEPAVHWDPEPLIGAFPTDLWQ